MKFPLLLVCAITAGLLLVGGAPAGSTGNNNAPKSHCKKIKAVGVGRDLGDGNTVATIKRAGWLNGTTAAHFDITGGTPPVLTFAGTIVFTAKKGTLTVGIDGTFNVATGAFDATGPVTSGTGRFDGATGTLTFSGVEDFSTGAFEETVRGQVCLDHDEKDDD